MAHYSVASLSRNNVLVRRCRTTFATQEAARSVADERARNSGLRQHITWHGASATGRPIVEPVVTVEAPPRNAAARRIQARMDELRALGYTIEEAAALFVKERT